MGIKFLRQRSISKYIVDFFSPDVDLIIEVDGASHDEYRYDYDVKRQIELESLGFKVIRFTEYEVVKKTKKVLDAIAASLTLPSPKER